MPRFRYHEDWRISHRLDCHFWVTCRSLKDALWIASLKGRDAYISVHADCEHAGIEAVAHVGIELRDARGHTIDEIFDLFDAQVDAYIDARVTLGTWGRSENVTKAV